MKFHKQWDSEAMRINREATDSHNDEPSLTVQSAAADCDLNVLVKRIMRGQMLMPEPLTDDYFQDISNLPDLRGAMEYIQTAREHFDDLPAEMRARWQNNPANLWNWLTDEKNHEEAIELGILAKPAAIAPQEPAAPPAEPPAKPAGDK